MWSVRNVSNVTIKLVYSLQFHFTLSSIFQAKIWFCGASASVILRILNLYIIILCFFCATDYWCWRLLMLMMTEIKSWEHFDFTPIPSAQVVYLKFSLVRNCFNYRHKNPCQQVQNKQLIISITLRQIHKNKKLLDYFTIKRIGSKLVFWYFEAEDLLWIVFSTGIHGDFDLDMDHVDRFLLKSELCKNEVPPFPR